MPISISSAEPFLNGLYFGMLSNVHRSYEITVLQGRNHFMAATNQITQLSLSFQLMNKALQAYQLPERRMTLLTYGLPIGLGLLARREFKNIYARNFVNFAQSHLGHVSLAIAVISNIALYQIGQRLLAVTTLTYLALGVIDRYNLLPDRVHQIMEKGNHTIGSLAGIAYGGTFVQVISAYDIAMQTAQLYQNFRKRGQPEETPSPVNNERPQRIETDEPTPVTLAMLSDNRLEDPLLINRAHLNRNLLPAVRDDITLDNLITLCDGINWDNHINVIKAKLQDDERWREMAAGTQNEVTYFKENLKKLVDSIKHREILEGRPQNFHMLETYARYIAQELENQDELTQADCLLTLGIEGGEYCGPGKFRVVEEIFSNLISLARGLPLEWRVLAYLQHERIEIFQQLFNFIIKSNPVIKLSSYFCSELDIHNYDAVVNMTQAGSRFGIPHQAAANDETAYMSPSVEMACKRMRDDMGRLFWNGASGNFPVLQKNVIPLKDYWKVWKWYSLGTESMTIRPYSFWGIMARLEETIGTVQLPISDIYEWWEGWIQRQDLSNDEKARLSEDLAVNAQLNGEPLECDGQFKYKFLAAMLLEMGVFKL
ncbi:MAG: hypothetical protein LW832_09970 [Parachlamydia sp.]|jgi:hypothetical protein|nr:hypothetical protein [Parachlamydia sp.]